MPELPEVEVVRRGLDPYVTGRILGSVQVLNARSVRRHEQGIPDFEDALRGRQITRVSRRGKFLWMPLDDGSALVVHLGMSGQVLLPAPRSPDGKHLRVRLTLEGADRQMHFVDQRMFGGMHIDDVIDDGAGGRVPSSVAHIARDPLDPDLDEDHFIRRMRQRRSGVKRCLLDQTLISGIGNIYADEALWRARLHYDRPGRALSRAQGVDLLHHIRDVMAEALADGGTSFDALYVNVNGESGWFDRSLNAYGQEGRPCARCGTAVVREHFMNRSSFRCPRCQRRPRATR